MTGADDDLQPLIAGDYLALADLLEGLSPARWETPSLCEGWRVREVVAHMTMPGRYDEPAFMAELRECDFDFTKLSNRVASRDGQLPAEELVAVLRSEVLHGWTPPGGGSHGALSHVVIHSLDITVPLGEPRRSPDATIGLVLDDLTRGGAHDHFGTDIAGRTLQATDIDWTFGSGPPVRASAEHLVLELTGRRVPA
ncbi:MAG TPA: maleylpyruvate isomerase family mycothiol-dependent enzyme [Acidimicrobiales bacterium]